MLHCGIYHAHCNHWYTFFFRRTVFHSLSSIQHRSNICQDCKFRGQSIQCRLCCPHRPCTSIARHNRCLKIQPRTNMYHESTRHCPNNWEPCIPLLGRTHCLQYLFHTNILHHRPTLSRTHRGHCMHPVLRPMVFDPLCSSLSVDRCSCDLSMDVLHWHEI